MAASAAMARPAAHVEERRLITYLGDDGLPVEKRKRGTVVDGLLGWTDDGFTIHIPTGRNIGPGEREIKDDRKLVFWMLDQDPQGWEASRSYKLGEPLTPALASRLKATRDSYPGD